MIYHVNETFFHSTGAFYGCYTFFLQIQLGSIRFFEYKDK